MTAEREITLRAGDVDLRANLTVPEGASGVVVFAHGTGSGRHSPRNRYVAEVMQEARVGTLLMDLLTEEEEQADLRTGELRFDIDFLARRVQDARRWLGWEMGELPVGYFGASTGAAAALVAAARSDDVDAIVSRGGRPDLAGASLEGVRAPILLIVGSRNVAVLDMNRAALEQLRCEKRLEVVEGASHLFEEPGTLEKVAGLAGDWFVTHLSARGVA